MTHRPHFWICALLFLGQHAAAQVVDSTRGRWTAPVVLLGDPATELLRSRLLRNDSANYSLFQSPSSATPRLRGSATGFRAAFVLPHLRHIHNSDLPYSLNDGALWAGRGSNSVTIAGARLEWKRLRVFALPELTISANEAYDVTVPDLFEPVEPPREPWASPFHFTSQSIDLPIRFGDKRIERLHPGQSSAVLTGDRFDIGFGTENNWWGPGTRNALLLSNHAAGFRHLFIRTSHPLETPIGRVEARWMSGGLSDSKFFYEGTKESLRKIALLGATIQPRGVDGLTIGAGRSVFSLSPNWNSSLTAFFDVFHDIGQPDAVDLYDTSSPSAPDQLLSLFMRRAFPADGFEVYAEWGRAEFPKSLRDFLEQPNHTQAYTIGLQWLGTPLGITHGQLRVQGEATFLQQSTTYRFRPLGSWYTSATTRHGYTQEGQVIGAAIGPGSSSQWVAIDHLTRSWSIGAYVNRIRWLEDARSQRFELSALPIGNGWCEHDVSFLGGAWAAATTRFGSIAADYSSGWRFDVFFKHDRNSCPYNQGYDVRNKSLTLTLSPAALRW